MLKISNRAVIEITLATWFIVTVLYLIYTPIGLNSHDFGGHVDFTKVIVRDHKLPTPFEGWEAYQPPLYYLINSFLSPKSLLSDITIHCNYVRAMSVLYGAITLLLIFWLLGKVANINNFHKLLVLLFIATTPKFIFVFSTYNNDSLATMLSVALLVISYMLYLNWSKKKALLLLLISIAAVYTKLSAIAAIILVVLVCSRNLLKLKFPNIFELKIIFILIISVLSLLPWCIMHNHAYTGQFFPLNKDGLGGNVRYEKGQALKVLSPFAVFSNIPEHKWDEPWAYPSHHQSSKRFDYLSYSFITSIIAEFTYNTPTANWAWALLIIHLVIYLTSFKEVLRSKLTKLAGLTILTGHMIQILFMLFALTSCGMDYRYVAWTWAGWAILYASNLTRKHNNIISKLLMVGILIQIYFVLNIT